MKTTPQIGDVGSIDNRLHVVTGKRGCTMISVVDLSLGKRDAYEREHVHPSRFNLLYTSKEVPSKYKQLIHDIFDQAQ